MSNNPYWELSKMEEKRLINKRVIGFNTLIIGNK